MDIIHNVCKLLFILYLQKENITLSVHSIFTINKVSIKTIWIELTIIINKNLILI